jgi:hypothetical protein
VESRWRRKRSFELEMVGMRWGMGVVGREEGVKRVGGVVGREEGVERVWGQEKVWVAGQMPLRKEGSGVRGLKKEGRGVRKRG